MTVEFFQNCITSDRTFLTTYTLGCMTKDEQIDLLQQEVKSLKKRVDNLTDFSLVTDNNIKTIHENIKILNKKLDLQSELIRLTRKQLDLLAGVEEGKL